MKPRAFGYAAVLAIALVLPILIVQPVYQNVLIWICLYAMMGAAWNLLGGFTGQLLLGQAAFFGIGAYASTLLLLKLQVPAIVGMWAGALLAALFGALIGWPGLRLRGPFFGLATLAVAEVLRLTSTAWTGLTNGSHGLFVPTAPAWQNLVFQHRSSYVWIAIAATLVTFGAMTWLASSQLGLRLKAVREDEDAAEAIGINAAKVKVLALMVSAAVTAICGTFYAQYLFFVDPDSVFSINLSIQAAMVAIVGGVGHPLGPLLGSIVLVPFQELVRSYLGGAYQGIYGVVYGAGLMSVVILAPRGLIRLFEQRNQLSDRKADVDPGTMTAPSTSSSAGPLMSASGLSKRFGGIFAVKDVDFSIGHGEVLGVIGPNGAGKSTLFNLLAGALTPSHGTISFLNKQLPARRSPHGSAQLGIARTFQLVRPFSDLSVEENIEAAALMRKDGDAAKALANWAIETTGLAPDRYRKAGELALGSRKRLEIARALATQPRLLLLDEVMAGLNPAEVKAMLAIVHEVRKSGVSVLMTEHLLHAVMAVCDRLIVMHHGEVIADGTPSEVVKQAKVVEVYLGRRAGASA
jgi:branched-chain amino acid transport system permease protein